VPGATGADCHGCSVNPDVPDVCEFCNTSTGQCEVDLTRDPICQAQDICRTPGFWAEHADQDPDKHCSQDITGAAIAACGGSISVCGQTITNTNLDNAHSALEAMCIKVRGTQTLQLARQLTAAQLNCCVTGDVTIGNDCSVADLINTCNAVCAGTSTAKTVGDCISAIDCFNNGGTFSNGTCTPGGANNCHNQALPLSDLNLPNNNPASGQCFGQQGAAGSPDECNTARNGNSCVVIPAPNGSGCP
jgi:hypothetical protein